MNKLQLGNVFLGARPSPQSLPLLTNKAAAIEHDIKSIAGRYDYCISAIILSRPRADRDLLSKHKFIQLNFNIISGEFTAGRRRIQESTTSHPQFVKHC